MQKPLLIAEYAHAGALDLVHVGVGGELHHAAVGLGRQQQPHVDAAPGRVARASLLGRRFPTYSLFLILLSLGLIVNELVALDSKLDLDDDVLSAALDGQPRAQVCNPLKTRPLGSK